MQRPGTWLCLQIARLVLRMQRRLAWGRLPSISRFGVGRAECPGGILHGTSRGLHRRERLRACSPRTTTATPRGCCRCTPSRFATSTRHPNHAALARYGPAALAQIADVNCRTVLKLFVADGDEALSLQPRAAFRAGRCLRAYLARRSCKRMRRSGACNRRRGNTQRNAARWCNRSGPFDSDKNFEQWFQPGTQLCICRGAHLR